MIKNKNAQSPFHREISDLTVIILHGNPEKDGPRKKRNHTFTGHQNTDLTPYGFLTHCNAPLLNFSTPQVITALFPFDYRYFCI